MVAVTLAVLAVALIGSLALLGELLGRTRRSVSARPLSFVVMAIAIWIGVNLAVVLAKPSDPSALALWALPPAAAAAAGSSAVASALLTPRWRMTVASWTLLSIHPTVMVLLALIPSGRALVFSPLPDGSMGYGPVLYLHVAAMVVIISLTFVRVVRARRQMPAFAAIRGSTIALGWIVPLVAGLVTTLNVLPPGVDLTSAGLAASAILIWVGILRPGLLELQPVARDWVFEKLRDAIFVVNTDGTIVDQNESAVELVRRRRTTRARGALALRDVYPEFMDVVDERAEEGREIDISVDGDTAIVWVTATRLEREGNVALGALVHVRDVTDNAIHQREAESMRLALEAEARVNSRLRAELSDQVMRDPATGLRNRRFVGANVPAMMLRAVSQGIPFSVIMLDVDHFKQVNDLHGHTVGDRVIASVASALSEAAPADAEVVRFGGEEFLVVLPGATADEAFEIAESLRAACAAVTVATRDGDVQVRLSAGVAAATPHHESSDGLIDDADQALYSAKEAGRDRTELFVRGDDEGPLGGVGSLDPHRASA